MNFAKDLGGPFKAFGMMSDKHPHMKRNDAHMKSVISAGHDIEHVTGHSYGGFQALRAASKHKIPATVYNPEIFFRNHETVIFVISSFHKLELLTYRD